MNVVVEQLTDGPGVTMVVVDFAKFSDEGSIAESLRSHATDQRVLLVDPVTSVTGAGHHPTVDDLAAAVADELDRQGIRPGLVVGYCSAAVLSLLLGDILRHRGQEPAAVLVQPAWLTAEQIGSDLREARAALGADGPLPEMSLTTVLTTLAADLNAKLRADGLSDEDIELCSELLLARYESWFGFLFATLATPVPVPSGAVTVIATEAGAPAAVAALPAGQVVLQRLPLDVPELLRSPLTTSAILDAALLDSPRT